MTPTTSDEIVRTHTEVNREINRRVLGKLQCLLRDLNSMNCVLDSQEAIKAIHYLKAAQQELWMLPR